jgi:hypothetical protein
VTSMIMRILCEFLIKELVFASCLYHSFFTVRLRPSAFRSEVWFLFSERSFLPRVVCCSSSLECAACSRIRFFSGQFVHVACFSFRNSISGAVVLHWWGWGIFYYRVPRSGLFPHEAAVVVFLQRFSVSSHLFFGLIPARALKVLRSSRLTVVSRADLSSFGLPPKCARHLVLPAPVSSLSPMGSY